MSVKFKAYELNDGSSSENYFELYTAELPGEMPNYVATFDTDELYDTVLASARKLDQDVLIYRYVAYERNYDRHVRNENEECDEMTGGNGTVDYDCFSCTVEKEINNYYYRKLSL